MGNVLVFFPLRWHIFSFFANSSRISLRIPWEMQLQEQPIMSIDAKKTEKIGNMKNNGREWMPPGETTNVDVYDFGQKDPNKKGRIMKAIPYGIYDVLKKQGFVNVGIDHNTAEFAVASLTNWWSTIGS